MTFRRFVVRTLGILAVAFVIGRMAPVLGAQQSCNSSGPTCANTCFYQPGSDFWTETDNCQGCYMCHFYTLWVYTETEIGCTSLCEVVYDGYCEYLCP